MADPTCYGSLQVCATRVATLAANGEPDPGPENGYVTNSLISMDIAVELADDVDLEKLNGCGDLCQSYFKQGAIKRATLSGAFCELDLQLGNLLLGGQLARAGGGAGAVFGWQAALPTDPTPNGVSLELWTRAWDGQQQATPAVLAGESGWWHWVFPLAKFQLDQMTTENDFLEFAITGFSTENSSMPNNGPFNDWGDDLADAGGIKACMGIFLDTEPPDAACEFIEVPAIVS